MRPRWPERASLWHYHPCSSNESRFWYLMGPGEGIKPSVLASVPKLRTCMGFAGSHAGWSNGIQAHARLCRLFSRLEQWMHHPSCTGKVCIGEIGCSSFLNTFLTLKTFLGPLKKIQNRP